MKWMFKYFITMIITMVLGGLLHAIYGTQDQEYLLLVQLKSKSMCHSLKTKYQKAGIEAECKKIEHKIIIGGNYGRNN
ncbi:MAG: hypothetical protein KDK36_20205 [Leptospiraceae bacterium]|nr:hypothetical protein [Leptospiraceae bacterium]